MALDPLTTGIAKSASSAAIRPTVGFLRKQVVRRGAAFADLTPLGTADPELDEALGILRGGSSSLPAAIVAKLKGWISDCPDSFADHVARVFIGDGRVVELVKSGARGLLRGHEIDAERARARELHAEIFGGDGIYGETLVEDAIAFAAMTLLAHLTPADRQAMELIVDLGSEVRGGFAQVIERIDALKASPFAAPVEGEAFDNVVTAGTMGLRRRRMLPITELPDEAVAFGQRVRTGLRLASPEVRGEAFREVAALLIRAGRAEEASPWIADAESVGADVANERARVAMSEDRVDDALRLLRDRSDPLSRGLLLDAIAKRDGDAAALTHFKDNFRGQDLTGHALQTTATRMLLAGDAAGSAELLDGATDAQIDENPVLLYIRARHRLSRAVPPDIGRRLIEHEGMLPRRTDLRDDVEGRRLLGEVVSDLKRLAPLLMALGAPDFGALVEVNLIALRLNAAEPAEREVARAEFVGRMADPAEAMHLAPVARMYGVELDWAPIRAALTEAEKLGGLDDAQLRAAFTIIMDEGEPAEVANFVHRYRERLEPYSTHGSVVAIEVEALAKAGRQAEAISLLEAERATLGEETATFLETTFAELAGADTVQARLDQFERSCSTHDLEVLVGTMGRSEDPRLGEYLAKLWRVRRQVSDARRACDAFVQAGMEREAEAFLEEIGDEAVADLRLRTHLAWARYRQGRLGEAEAKLAALDDMGVDDANTRQLRVLIAIETGRWRELEPHVQVQLAARADREPDELLAAARIARAIGSAATIDLLRAAVAKDPTNGRIAVQAYWIATEAGIERSAEVGGWFGTALADKERSGLVPSTGLDQVIEMMSSSRSEADRISGLINTAAVPMFMGIGAMGGTQSALVIRQMPSNAAETDSRRRSVVPLFAGNRALRYDLRPASISFDPLSILVLDQLRLLDLAIDAFDEVVLPSGTLHSFFEDLAKAAHSQPSRVVQAQAIRDAVSGGLIIVEDAQPTNGSGGADAEGVDEEFAALHAAAVGRNGYVVDTAPLHPTGRLDVTVDPSPYADRLLSPAGVVAALSANGTISRSAASVASSAVAGSGGPFDAEPVLARGRPLFMSGLAVQYLSDAELLPDLKAYAGELRTLKATIEHADREIAGGAVAEVIRAGIERVRATLARAIADGRARVGPARRLEDEEARESGRRESLVRMSPVMSVLRDAAGVDAFVCDDRAMNKYPETVDRTGHKVTFITTADLLGILRGIDVIDEDAVEAARERLRRSGAGMVPVDPLELKQATLASDWSVGPNAELRAIRDSIHLPIARKVLQLPEERPWLRAVSLAIAYSIRSAWIEIEDDDEAERAANYLLDLLPDPAALSAHEQSPDLQDWIAEVTRFSIWAFAVVYELREPRIERHRRWFETRVESLASARDPGAIAAVAATLYASMIEPMDLDEDDVD